MYTRRQRCTARMRMSCFVPKNRITDPVERADHRSRMDDLRIAFTITGNVPLDDIDPSSGHNLTRAAYESVRESWRTCFKDEGGLTTYTRPWFEEGFASWAAKRPEFTAGDGWFAGLYQTDDETESAA